MKKLSLLLALALIISLFAPTTASAAENTSNDLAANATVIIPGTTTGMLETAEDVDYYKIEATDDYFTFQFGISASSLGANVGQGWVVTVYNSVLEELLSYTTESSFESPRLCYPGPIYIKVEAKNTYASYAPIGVSYDLTYSCGEDANWEDEHNDLSTSANPINVNTTYRGSLLLCTDADWYVVNPLDYFSVTLSRNMEIPTEWDVNNGWRVTVYDSALNELTSFTTDTSATSLVFPVSGPIYIKVEAANDYISYAPRHVYYDLKVNSATNAKWENEYNDSSTTANTITQGTVYHGNLHSAGDVDFFKVKSTSKAIAVNFKIDLAEVDPGYVNQGWKITVYAANTSKSIATYTVDAIGSFKSITLPYAKGGYYYVKVEAANDYVSYAPIGQPYHISVVDASADKNWEVENGKTGVTSATTLAESKVIYGNLCNADDMDYFKCKVVSGGTIKLTFKRDASDNDSNGYKVSVVDNAGNVVFSDTVDNVTSKSFSGIKVSKGTYYIIVEAANSYYHPGAEINYNISYKLTISKHKVKASGTSNTIKLSWNKKSDVTGYEIQYATNKNFENATKKTFTKNTTTSFTIKNTSAAKVYYVRLRTYVKDGDKTYYSGWTTIAAMSTPSAAKVTPTKSTLKVTWNKNSSATGYQIEYATNKNFENATRKTFSSNSTTSYTIKNTSATKAYYVRVRTYVTINGTTYYSNWSTAKAAANTPTVKELTPSKGTLKVSWTKNTGATGYQIEYATNKNFENSKIVKISGNSTTSVTIKNTSANQTYYVRIRVVVNSTYSPWSAAVSVKAK